MSITNFKVPCNNVAGFTETQKNTARNNIGAASMAGLTAANYAINAITNQLAAKQDLLVAGTGIDITNNVISNTNYPVRKSIETAGILTTTSNSIDFNISLSPYTEAMMTMTCTGNLEVTGKDFTYTASNYDSRFGFTNANTWNRSCYVSSPYFQNGINQYFTYSQSWYNDTSAAITVGIRLAGADNNHNSVNFDIHGLTI